MKKSAWIALAILAALAGLYFVISEEPSKTVDTPMTIEAVDELSRVEIAPPGGAKDSELIVFEKAEGAWWMTRPVQSELSRQTKSKLAGLFAEKTRTDDLRLSTDNPRQYGLDDESAVKISAYPKGSDTAAVELEVGEQMTVEQTGVRRTYVRKPGEERIYRAQFALGDFVRKPVDDHRSKKMVDLDREAFTKVTIAPENIVLERDGDKWKLAEPEAERPLDQNKARRLIGAVARVRASGFADEKKPADAGLEPAKASVTIETADGKTHTLAIGNEADGKKVYLRFDDGVIFTVARSTADRLQPSVDSLLEKKEQAANTETPGPSAPEPQ